MNCQEMPDIEPLYQYIVSENVSINEIPRPDLGPNRHRGGGSGTQAFRHERFRLAGADTDNDGMPDSWETLYTFLINNPADAHLDADGDGQTNLDEYRAGTHPRDPNSVFRILSIDVAPDRSRLDFTWSSVPGRTYTVWHSTNLSVWTQIDSGTAGTSQTLMAGAITNPALLPAGKVFLQVRVSFP